MTIAEHSTNYSRSIPITLDVESRWFYVGKTGSGKSTLMRHNLRAIQSTGWRILIIDGTAGMWTGRKDDFAKKGNGTVDRPRKITDTFNPHYQVSIYQPDPNVPGWQDDTLLRILTQVYEEGRVLLCFDEIFDVLDGSHVPSEIRRIWTQGRKLYVAAWAGCQEPKNIPRFLMSNAESWAVFRLTDEDDLDRVAARTSSPEIRDVILDPYYFWYYNSEMDHAQLMKPIEVKS